MSDEKRLAALLEAAATYTSAAGLDPEHYWQQVAARLITAGVRVGDDGLRALKACAEALHHHPGSGFGPTTCEACAAREMARAALAASPAPTLDRERLARALDRYFRGISARHPGATWVGRQEAAAIADAYEADLGSSGRPPLSSPDVPSSRRGVGAVSAPAESIADREPSAADPSAR